MKNYTSKEMKRFNYLLGETEAIYHEVSLRLGLSDSAMKVLYTICDNGGSCLLQEICRRSSLSKQTLNSAIRKLEREGVLYLESTGGRVKKVCLTDEGETLVSRTALRIIKMENAIFSFWPKEDVETYLELTERFLLDLKKKAKEL